MKGPKSVPARQPEPAHRTCFICREIPDRCRSFDKGGESVESTMPAAVGRLLVVGAPFYNQETSGSNWCLLRCAECGTYYDWDFEYEYLAGGSEDDLTVTRLSREDGERKAAQVAGYVAAARARFAGEAPAQLKILGTGSDPATVREAASWLFSAQNRGNDLTPYLPDVLAAWRRPEAHGDAAGTLHLVLFVHGSRSREHLASLRSAIASAGLAAQPEMEGLLRTCENALRSADGSRPLGSA